MLVFWRQKPRAPQSCHHDGRRPQMQELPCFCEKSTMGQHLHRFRSLTFQLFRLHTVLEHEIQRFPEVSLSMTVAPLKSLTTVVPRSKLVMHPEATMTSWLVHVMFCFHPRASKYCVAMSAGLTSVGTLRTLEAMRCNLFLDPQPTRIAFQCLHHSSQLLRMSCCFGQSVELCFTNGQCSQRLRR